MTTARLRFAPSPNGPLHLGHALSALTGHRLARRLGGRFLVRIEDIDLARTREDFVAAILDDLAWLGIVPDEPVLRQSTRFAAYGEATLALQRLGVLYPCFATRSQIATAAGDAPGAVDPDGAPLVRGLHKSLGASEVAERKRAGQPFALRLDMAHALELAAVQLGGAPLTFTEHDETGTPQTLPTRPQAWGDAVIVRKDVPANYHLAVVVDDAAQAISCVTRGEDLKAATDLQRLLQVLLDLPAPTYLHHRLIRDASGRKLAKSAGDTALARLRADGAQPSDICRMIGLPAT